jgi:DNA-binding transcriptional LysR family regulator
MLEHTNLQKGSIKIGAIPNITYLGITSLIAALQKTYPGINMELYEENSDDLLKKLHTHERTQIDLSELAQEKFLMIKSSTGLRNELIQICRNAGFEPHIIFESSHVETIRGLIEEGIGILLSSNRVGAKSQPADLVHYELCLQAESI